MKKLRFIFPRTENFRETRPEICWEHMYGWMDGYGVLFDPAVTACTGLIPEWENGWNGRSDEGDFLVAPCHQASALLEGSACPGIYVRPKTGVAFLASDLRSDKELLVTPVGRYYYPRGTHEGLPYDRYASGLQAWRLAEHPAVASCGKGRLALSFEFFSMLWALNADWPERRLAEAADMMAALVGETKCFPAASASPRSGMQEESRLDFQAYGLNRLFVQWFLEIHGQDKSKVADADRHYLAALDAWNAERADGVHEELTAAFGALAALRKAHSRLEIYFCEYPHMGILLDNKGFFELEWPEYSRRIIESFVHHIEKHGYKFSLEAGAGCWKNLAARFPGLVESLRGLWAAEKIDLTNGTYSLPYALVSPLMLQYEQLRLGHETFRKVFGRAPTTYQAQENSLGPHFPELLRHFGYRLALHISQNHGTGPQENSNFITWRSPSGCGIPAMSVRERALSRKGNNYYLDLPLIHRDYGCDDRPLDYVNFQDLGYVPFRVHMIRANAYAPVWGTYALSAERFLAEYTPSAPARSYSADAYQISANIFYGNYTNANALSQYERVFTLSHRYRQTQFMAFAAGRLRETAPGLTEVLPGLLLQEAHDVAIVQDQRRGEFHSSCTMDSPPYSRDTLMEEVCRLYDDASLRLDNIQAGLAGGGGTLLYNASGVTLAYARVRTPGVWRGPELPAHRGKPLACGPFAPFSAGSPGKTETVWNSSALPLSCGRWKAEIMQDSRISLSYSGQSVYAAPVDKLRGYFTLLKTQARICGPFAALELIFAHADGHAQIVKVDMLLHEDASFAEFAVSYAPRGGFSVRNRWEDYLALEFQCGAPLDTLWRFNPNVRSVTGENRIASPCYLAAAPKGSNPIALLNEGSFLYEADRNGGILRWLFHVASETRTERRMAVAFGADNAFELSRAWSQGLAPLEQFKLEIPMPEGTDRESLCAEIFTSDGALLVSNLKDKPVEFKLPEGLSLRRICGVSAPETRSSALEPFELAFLGSSRLFLD